MRKMRFVLALSLVFMLFAASTSFAAHKWRLASHAMPGTSQFRLAEVFCQTVNTLSEGELVIEPYAAGVLFPVFDTFDNVANGVVEAGMAYSAYWTGKDPVFTLTTRPGCPLSTFAEGAYLENKLEEHYKKLYGKFGIEFLGYVQVSPMYEQLMSVTPIRSLEDVKGKKIRTSGFGALYYRALGATTVSLSAPEIYTAFQTKNIDAAEWTFWDDNMRMGFHEVSLYVLDPALHNGTCDYLPLFVNPGKWEKLPQHLKDIVIVARDRARYESSLIYVDEVIAREKWQAMPNIEYVRWSDADEKKAREIGLGLVLEECNKTEEGKKYLEIYRNTLWELGYKDEAKFLGHGA